MNTFRDRLLVCAECGGQFVFTVGEQRRMMEEQGHIEDPTYCPVCSVKLQRNTTSAPAFTSAPEESAEELPDWLMEPARATSSEPADVEPAEEAPSAAPRREDEPHPLQGQNCARRQGTVKWFNNRKGFGFITLEDGNELFVHYSGIAGDGYRSLEPDQRVTLVVEETDKGPQASQVEVIDE